MAEINIFHFRKADTFVHRLDPRSKFFMMLALSVTFMRAGILTMAGFTVLLLTVFIAIMAATPGTSFSGFMREMRFFLILFGIITILRGLNPPSGTDDKFLNIFSTGGIRDGLFYSWRLLLVFLLGQLFAVSTSPADLQEGLYLLFRPVPLVPAGKAATVVSLTIGFIPLIFDQYREVRQAWLSRLGNLDRNIFRRVSTLVLPLLENILGRADETACAMESRCYTDTPPWTDLEMHSRDYAAILVSATLLVLSIVFKY